MYKIKEIKASEILDSRGNPTVEVEIIAEKKCLFKNKEIKAWAQVPSGASTGDFEAVELRDGGERYGGKGVLKAIENIHKIITPEILGINVLELEKIDKIMLELDGTENKSNLGANAILPISMAVTRLGAIAKKQKLYEYIAEISENENFAEKNFVRPFFNIINGGMHAGNKIAFQEFMISPNLKTFEENYKSASEIYHTLKKILKEKFGGVSTLLGDEGGFAPNNFDRENEALDLIMEAIEKSGYKNKVDLALDVAASEFFENKKYNLGFKNEKNDFKTVDEMIKIYKNLVEKYPIISIEDPFDQSDFIAFAKLKSELFGKGVQIVADDLTVTNTERIQKAINKKSADSLLLKINQIGTITESIQAFKLAKSDNWTVMVSHRSGETTDDFIADFAVGIGAEQIKSGATARGERIVKYNRLKTIEKLQKM